MPYQVTSETIEHVFQRGRDIVWRIYFPDLSAVRNVKAKLMYYPDYHVPIRVVTAIMLAVFRTALTAQHYDHDRNSRAHNSAYLRVLSSVWYYPVSDRPDDDWWKSAYSICRHATVGRERVKKWSGSGAITGFLPWRQAGELPRLGQQLVRFQTLCRRNRSPLYEEPFTEPARGREIGFSASPRDLPLNLISNGRVFSPIFSVPALSKGVFSSKDINSSRCWVRIFIAISLVEFARIAPLKNV